MRLHVIFTASRLKPQIKQNEKSLFMRRNSTREARTAGPDENGLLPPRLIYEPIPTKDRRVSFGLG